MSSNESNIPLIDFSPFLADEGVLVGDEPTPKQQQVSQQIDKVCREHGFLCMINFGMSVELRDRAFAASAELFAMSEAEKAKLVRITPQTNMGHAPLRSESINRSRPPELKEAYNIRFPPRWTNDLTACPETFASAVDVLSPFYKDLAHRYATACALALNIPTDYFSKTLVDYDLCTVRMLHYPPCDWNEAASADEAGDTSKPIRIGEHTDFGAFTFLLVHPDHGPDGLQLKSVQGGEVGGEAGGEKEGWQDVTLPPVDKNTPVLIVNTGALMARWTNDAWNATAHRVVVTDEAAASRARYSIACFIDPDSNSLVSVHPNFATEGGGGGIKYEPIKSNEYLAEKLKSMMKVGQ